MRFVRARSLILSPSKKSLARLTLSSKARVEELVRIWEARPVGKGKLHLTFVGVGDCDYSVVRPHRASHPLPFLDYLPVGLEDALADAGERFATPVCEFCDQPVNTFRWIHWIFMPRIRVPFHIAAIRRSLRYATL